MKKFVVFFAIVLLTLVFMQEPVSAENNCPVGWSLMTLPSEIPPMWPETKIPANTNILQLCVEGNFYSKEKTDDYCLQVSGFGTKELTIVNTGQCGFLEFYYLLESSQTQITTEAPTLPPIPTSTPMSVSTLNLIVTSTAMPTATPNPTLTETSIIPYGAEKDKALIIITILIIVVLVVILFAIWKIKKKR